MTPDYIKNIIETRLEISIREKSRKWAFIDARMIYAKLSRQHTTAPIRVIAEGVNKNHATILNAIKQADNLIETDKAFRKKYEGCKELVERELQLRESVKAHLRATE